MSDIIEKIGKYFADQEAQQRQLYTLAVQSPGEVRPPVTYQTPHQPLMTGFRRSSASVTQRPPPSLLRRRLSLQSMSSASSKTNGLENESHVSSMISKARTLECWHQDDSWSDDVGESLKSWRSAGSDNPNNAETDHPETHSSDGRYHATGTRSKKTKQRKISIKNPRKSSNQTPEEDPEVAAREKAEKVASALARAQDRAKQIQLDRRNQIREQQRVLVEAASKKQDELAKIEVIRLKSKQLSFRLRPQSAPSTPCATTRSESEFCPPDGPATSRTTVCDRWSNEHDNAFDLSDWQPSVLDHGDVESIPVKNPKSFLDAIEDQVRFQMILNMRIKKKHISNQQSHDEEYDRVSHQLSKVREHNEKKQKSITRLEATRQALERDLAQIEQEVCGLRQQRTQMEEVHRRERQQRQKDAERELRQRVRVEEWRNLEQKEKERSEMAAKARAKANQRIVSRASSLRKMLEVYEHERHSKRSNNMEDEVDLFVTREPVAPPPTVSPVHKISLFPPPELAEFEEDGLLIIPNRVSIKDESEQEGPESHIEGYLEEDEHTDITSTLGSASAFIWQIPSFEDSFKMEELLLNDMISSDEDDNERKAERRTHNFL